MAEEETVVETETTEGEQDPAPSQERPRRSKAEIAAFNLKKHAEEAKALGLDPAEILGAKPKIEPTLEDDDDKPVTVGMLKDMGRQAATKTALDMAQGIEDEDTRNLVTTYLNDNIKPSGNAEADFKLALAAAAASKNRQVLEELNRYGTPKKTAAGGSAPGRVDDEFVPTAQEQVFMGAPYNLSKEKILAARKAEADKRG